MKLRVLTYNLHKGFTSLPWLRKLRSRPTYIIDKMRDAIRSTHADLVFLQEIGGLENEKATENQLEFMADQIWTHFSYGRNAVYQDENPRQRRHHGNAILSKFPILFSENINISQNPLEKRGILHCRVDLSRTKSQPLEADLICTHLNLLEYHRQRQLVQLSHRIADKICPKAPFILAGDFNDWRHKATNVLRKNLHLHEVAHPKGFLTFPAQFPLLSLDRIFYKNIKLEHAHVTHPENWADLSDHLGIIADFTFPTDKAPKPGRAEV